MTEQAEHSLDGELHRRLVWLTFFRLAVVSVLFGATLLLGNVGGPSDLPSELQNQLLGVATAGFFATLTFALLLRARRHLLPLAYAEISIDVLLAAVLVYMTGGSQAFSFMFILAVANASLVLFQRGAVLAATLSSVTFAVLRTTLNAGWLAPPQPFLAQRHESASALLFNIFVNVGALFLVAALSSYLAEQLRRKNEQLSAKELDYEVLADLQRAILASIPSGVAAVNARGDVTFVNRAGWEICRPWLKEGGSLKLGDLLPGIDRAAAIDRSTLEVRRGDGRWWLGLTISELQSQDAHASTHVVVFQDLTELRRLESEAARNERLAAVGQLAAGLAHELRNPLASMSGAVQMLASPKLTDPDDRRLADIVVSESDRLNRLISDFLAFARPSTSVASRFDLANLAEQTLDVVAHGPEFEKVSIERQLQPAEVVGDNAQLRQVIWNLVVNAAQAMGGAGRLLVKVRGDGERSLLEVEDSGPGIAVEVLPRIFDPFFTTKAHGTGLGLSTVFALVRVHGGRVFAENRAEGGARFVVELPAADATGQLRRPDSDEVRPLRRLERAG